MPGGGVYCSRHPSRTCGIAILPVGWEIEVFFKQLKQTLRLADFLGTLAIAVRWRIWTALLIYLLLRCLAYRSHWAHRFSRLFAIIRTGLWRKWHLPSLSERYGTAQGHFRYPSHPEQAYFPVLPERLWDSWVPSSTTAKSAQEIAQNP